MKRNYRHLWLSILFMGIATLLAVRLVFAGSAILTWNAPTTYTDGTVMPLSNVGSYTIYSGSTATNMTNKLTLPIIATWPSLAIMTYTVNNLGPGTLYFGVSCTDILGSESGKSNIMSKNIILTPNAPSNLIIPGGVNYV